MEGHYANNVGFGVANVTESSQPYTHTTDGQSIRFDLFCASSPCSYGYTHTYNPSYGTSSETDGATSITTGPRGPMAEHCIRRVDEFSVKHCLLLVEWSAHGTPGIRLMSLGIMDEE